MNKKHISAVLLISTMPFFSSCASQDDVHNLNYNVSSINKKLTDMQTNTVDQIQQRQASSSGLLDQLQTDILMLKSKLEENAHTNRMLLEQNKELQLAVQNLSSQQEEQFKTKFAEMDTKIKSQKDSLTSMQQARVVDAERRAQAAKIAADDAMRKARQAAITKTAPTNTGVVHLTTVSKKIVFPQSSSSSSLQTTKTPTSGTPKPSSQPTQSMTIKKPVIVEGSSDHFADAQQQYRDGNFDKAYGLFEKNIAQKRSSKTGITSRYMMGECLFQQGQYDQAIIQYQQIISGFPGNAQAAKALLRQGEAFEQLSDTDTARIIYKKIIASYGSSPEAETARKKSALLQ